ncbi:ABC transporter ATP-binding protein [Pigmentiphaga litoralis]|uniref:ABC transporter ATP-binding protein n=1 Tax=Pigmentiphaga litoralis TaxID=516702 RepID=UPI001679AC1F|nr:ABC transporter ATP-binding protein [Pigmentiphaga litoralis]GGX19882.1 ABC transporter ATP-binding protein [Pigmentiphaga litoralis]
MTTTPASPDSGGQAGSASTAAASSPALLTVSDLHVSYGKVEALHGADLVVPAGSIVTVIGPNGAGKTTMLSAIMGLLPSRGTVAIDGVVQPQPEIEKMVALGLNLVPEKRELFGEMTVEDNLLLGAFSRYRRGERDQAASMDEVFVLFPRLKDRRKQLAGTLSGGERQMLALGRALMAKPRLLLLDEPSLGLAPRIVKEIFHIINELKARGVAILLVEQNARAALQTADYAYVLETGKVVLSGPAGELADDPRVVESYLGLGKH